MGKRTQKLLVYLDQNFLSEMSKADINENVRPEFKDIYEPLHEDSTMPSTRGSRSWMSPISGSSY
ncbi:MAG: hypothetical protein ABI693_26555 [Bryobacteraceae bacterium]